MKKIEKNGFILASSGTAQQVVLYCHGGWVESDGTTRIPQDLTVCFYAGHGQFTTGNSVYSTVVKKGETARKGFLKQLSISETDLRLWAESRGKTIQYAREEFMKSETGTYDSFGGGNYMYNYALSREPAGGRYDFERRLFDDHIKGKGHPDVDLLMMRTTGDRHLSDVFKLTQGRYKTLHFGACRVPYGASPSDVSA